MADISEIITLGIGTPSDIAHFILVGLNPETPPPSPSDMNNAMTGESGMTGGGYIGEIGATA